MHTAFMRSVLGRWSAGLPVQQEIAITADGSAPADDARLWVVEAWDTSTLPTAVWGAVGTVILSNGPTWGGQWPRPLADLLDALATAELDGRIAGACSILDEGVGSHLPGGGAGWTRYHGNFVDLSHAFTVDTRDPDVAFAIRAAMKANGGIRGLVPA